MKKYKTLIKKIFNAPLGFTIVTNIFTLILGLLVYRPYFEGNDDLNMALVFEGAYGYRDYHGVLVNSLLGRFEALLGGLISGVRWHSVLQFVFIFAAMFMITYYLSYFRMGKLGAAIIQLSCFYEVYVALQYTKTAAFVSAVSFLVILGIVKMKSAGDSRITNGCERALLICAYAVIFYGMLLSNRAFAVTMLIAVFPGIIDLFVFIIKKNHKAAGKYAAYIIPVFAVFLVVNIAEGFTYSSDPDWALYREYNQARENMSVGHIDALSYDLYADKLSELGVSENDAYLYSTSSSGEESVCSAKLMNDISSISPGTRVDYDFLRDFIRNIYKDIFVFNPVFIAFLMFGGIILAVSASKSKEILFLIGEMLFALGFFLYYQYTSEWNHTNVFVVIISVTVTLSTVLITSRREFFGRKIESGAEIITRIEMGLKLLLTLMMIFVFTQRLGNEFEFQEYLKKEKNFAVLQLYMEEEKDKLFIADTNTTGDKYKYNVFAALKEGSLDNYLDTGNYLTASPIAHGVSEAYGYYDAFDALRRGGENVILIDNFCPDRKAVYLTEHGDGPRYVAEYQENVCGYNLYLIK